MKHISAAIMGGTLDSERYPEEHEGEYPADATPAKILSVGAFEIMIEAKKHMGLSTEFNYRVICNKDSKDLTKNDIDALCDYIAQRMPFSDRIIVTMGTDKMCETAQRLHHEMPERTCPIIFTGAIWPLANGERSDGWNNIDKALFMEVPANDIYIVIGDYFGRALETQKNFSAKKFEPAKTEKQLEYASFA